MLRLLAIVLGLGVLVCCGAHDGTDADGGVDPPRGLTYSANPAVYVTGVAIEPNTPTSSGGTVVAYAVAPALPAGLSLDSISGALTGTPTTLAVAADYVVTAMNSGGSATASLSITVNCDPSAPFTSIAPLGGLASPYYTGGAGLSADELTIVFSSNRPPSGVTDVWIATRLTPTSAFSTPHRLAGVSLGAYEYEAMLSGDALTLYFHADVGSADLYYATRASTDVDFITASPLPGFTEPPLVGDSRFPSRSALYFGRFEAGASFDISRAPRTGPGPTDFGTAEPLAELASPDADEAPLLSDDELTIYFASNRSGTGASGGMDIWAAHRASVSAAFSTPHVVVGLNSSSSDLPDSLSADGCRLYFESDRGGNRAIYLAERTP